MTSDPQKGGGRMGQGTKESFSQQLFVILKKNDSRTFKIFESFGNCNTSLILS